MFSKLQASGSVDKTMIIIKYIRRHLVDISEGINVQRLNSRWYIARNAM